MFFFFKFHIDVLSFAGIQINEYGLQRNSEFDLLEIVHLPEQSLSQDQEQHAETVSTSRVYPARLVLNAVK